MHDYEAEAERIIGLLKTDFVLPGGELSRERVEGKLVSEHLFPDLGDVVPFLLYFGERDFAYSQIEAYKRSLKNGLLISQAPSLGIHGLVKSYEYTDLLFGLLDYAEEEPSEDKLSFVRGEISKAIKIFSLGKSLSSFYEPRNGLALPVIDTRDSTFIEVFLDARDLYKDESYLEIARNIYRRLVELPFYKKRGLLPTLALRPPLNLGFGKFNKVTVCKNNTNTLYSWLALYEATRDEEMLEDIKKLFLNISGESLSLTDAFPLIDFSADFYALTHWEKALEIGEEIARDWISRQGRTGLFPLKKGGKASFFDSETDMCVALDKLYELTGKEEYKNASDKCSSGIWQYHRPKDYILSVDVDSGSVLKEVQRTKFLALFLKLLVLKIEQSKGAKIYSDKKLWKLLRDR